MMHKAEEKNSNNEKYQFWQQHNQPIVLNNNDIFKQKLNYIHNNPVASGLVKHAEDWSFSSIHDYLIPQRDGLVKVLDI
jgi:hypothetical protein